MSNDELSMNLPEGWKQDVSRMLYGADHTFKEIKKCKIKLDKLYKKYNKNKDKRDEIDWDTIEDHFQEPIWYNAHTKMKRYENNMKNARRDMFYILTNFDGNGSEIYCEHSSISAQEIIESFEKYFKEKK